MTTEALAIFSEPLTSLSVESSQPRLAVRMKAVQVTRVATPGCTSWLAVSVMSSNSDFPAFW